jgi:hypothetical protein
LLFEHADESGEEAMTMSGRDLRGVIIVLSATILLGALAALARTSW